MSYLYCKRFCLDASDPLVAALREELYCEPYDGIDWNKYRHAVCPFDNYSPVHPLMRVAQNLLAVYEWCGSFRSLRDRGTAFALEYIRAEDQQTNFVDIGPVSKVLNMVALYHAGGCEVTEEVKKHLPRLDDYLWLAEDGAFAVRRSRPGCRCAWLPP